MDSSSASGSADGDVNETCKLEASNSAEGNSSTNLSSDAFENYRTSENKNDSDDDEFSDAKDECSDDCEISDIDDEGLAERHKNITEQELQHLKEEAVGLKNKGNEFFKKGEYKEAISVYTNALNCCPLSFKSDRAILYANRAAARISLEKNDDAILDCNKAIELNPTYLKALLRRAQLHRKMDNLERSLEDYKAILELDPNNAEARQACVTLPPEIAEKNERLKNEMFGKLKELGNICLKPFGLSTENFKVVQDPNSGGYSVNFQNNPS